VLQFVRFSCCELSLFRIVFKIYFRNYLPTNTSASSEQKIAGKFSQMDGTGVGKTFGQVVNVKTLSHCLHHVSTTKCSNTQQRVGGKLPVHLRDTPAKKGMECRQVPSREYRITRKESMETRISKIHSLAFGINPARAIPWHKRAFRDELLERNTSNCLITKTEISPKLLIQQRWAGALRKVKIHATFREGFHATQQTH